MNITINGEAKTFAAPMTISVLLQLLHVAPKQVAVEVNRKIIPKSTHDHAEIHDGDVVELVRFIGGG